MTLIELRQKKTSLVAELKTLNEKAGRSLDAAQQKRWDELTGEIKTLGERIGRGETVSDYERELDQPAQVRDANGNVIDPRKLLAPIGAGGGQPDHRAASQQRRPVPVEDRTVYDGWPIEEADQFLRAVVGMQTARQLPPGIHRDLSETFLSGPQYRTEPSGQSTLIDADGGFAVPATLADGILRKMFAEGQILSRVRQVQISIGRKTAWPAVSEASRKSGVGNRFGGLTVSRKGESVASTGSKIKLEQVVLELKKQTCLLYASEEQLEDGPQMMALINELTPQAFVFAAEEEILRGSGAAEMQGVLNSGALITIPKETSQSADTILAQNLLQMERRLAPGSIANSVVLCNQNALPQLRQMFLAIGTGGQLLWQPPTGLAAAPFGTIMGRPLIVSEHCSTLGDAGDLIWADFSQYLYGTKGALQAQQSIHVKFVEGELAFRFTLRNDGKSWWSRPLAPSQGDDDDDTVSPFIALAARA